MTAYYNEIDPNAAEWLRQLIKLGAIAPGDVDERSIEDVSPIELKPYTQVHFFAGIGVWSYALRSAGWPDDRFVWTGSCPCQPFSEAGKRGGFDDERHLWPAMFWHIQQCRPPIVFGEQVASKDGLGWWDIVASDLENGDYACAAFDLSAAGVGAPHIRQRLFWVANATGGRGYHRGRVHWGRSQKGVRAETPVRCELRIEAERSSIAGIVANTTSDRCSGQRQSGEAQKGRQPRSKFVGELSQRLEERSDSLHDFWGDAEWIPCLDGKARPVKPGAFPLVDGTASDLVCSGDHGISPHQNIQTESTAEARAMRLRGYGNAIVAPLAIEFIRAYMETV